MDLDHRQGLQANTAIQGNSLVGRGGGDRADPVAALHHVDTPWGEDHRRSSGSLFHSDRAFAFSRPLARVQESSWAEKFHIRALFSGDGFGCVSYYGLSGDLGEVLRKLALEL